MRTILKTALIACLLVLFCAVPAFAQDAQRLDVRMDVYEDGQLWSGAKLADDNWSSRLTLNGTGSVEITADEDICFLYVIWDRIPGPWLLKEEVPQGIPTRKTTLIRRRADSCP